MAEFRFKICNLNTFYIVQCWNVTEKLTCSKNGLSTPNNLY